MRDMSAELASLNADWRALREAAESLDCGAPDVWTMLLIELRAARADTRLSDRIAHLEALTDAAANEVARWAEVAKALRRADQAATLARSVALADAQPMFLASTWNVPAELVASEDTRLDDVLAELRAIRELLVSVTNNGHAVRVDQP